MSKLNNEKLLLVDPYDEDYKKMIEEFEKENGIVTSTGTYISHVSNVSHVPNVSKEEYEKNKKLSNEIKESLFLEFNSKVIDLCYIEGEKDIKACTVSFAPLKKKLKKRDLIGIATDYAINHLKMEEIFVKVSPEDKTMIDILKQNSFENLGENEGEIVFLKEREEELETQRKLSWIL